MKKSYIEIMSRVEDLLLVKGLISEPKLMTKEDLGRGIVGILNTINASDWESRENLVLKSHLEEDDDLVVKVGMSWDNLDLETDKECWEIMIGEVEIYGDYERTFRSLLTDFKSAIPDIATYTVDTVEEVVEFKKNNEDIVFFEKLFNER